MNLPPGHDAIERVVVTPAAQALIERLRALHGDVLFYQSHGCCDGSTPMCFAPGEMPLTTDDRLLGHASGAAFHASRAQCEYLEGAQLTLDAVPGSNGGFSLEDGTGQRFVLTLRLWTDDESRLLRLQPPLSPSVPAAPG